MNIYLYNRGRDGNIGDEIISIVLETSFRNLGFEVTLSESHHIGGYGILSAGRAHLASFINDIHKIKECDMVVIGGGNLIMDVSGVKTRWALHHFWLSLLCLLFRKKYHYCCVGAAPLQSSITRFLYGFALRKAEKISVRDSFSAQYIRKLIGRDNVWEMFDPALLISSIYPIAKNNRRSEKRSIGICPVQLYPNISSDLDIQQRYIDLHANLIETFIRNGHEVFLFMNDHAYDIAVFQKIKQSVPPLTPRFYAIESFLNYAEYLSFITTLDCIVSSRLHAVIIATSYGIPCIGYGWQPKMEYFFRDNNLGGYVNIIDSLDKEEVLEKTLSHTLNLYDTIIETTPEIQLRMLRMEEFLGLRGYK